MRLLWIEDGLGTYFLQGNYWRSRPNGLKAYLKRLLRMDYIYTHIYAQYIYRPELVEYSVPFLRRRIAFLQNKPQNFFANIYGFDESEEITEKYIYFDMPFEIDGRPTNDKQLLELIANMVGKENIMVKVHPRNSPDYYVQNGYKVLKKTYIPWEVYYMSSSQARDKVLISGFSGATVCPYLYFDDKDARVILLLDLLDRTNFTEEWIEGLKRLKEHIFLPSKAFFIPQTIEELASILKRV